MRFGTYTFSIGFSGKVHAADILIVLLFYTVRCSEEAVGMKDKGKEALCFAEITNSVYRSF